MTAEKVTPIRPELASYVALDELLQRRRAQQESIEFGRLQMRQLAEAIELGSKRLCELDAELSKMIGGLAS